MRACSPFVLVRPLWFWLHPLVNASDQALLGMQQAPRASFRECAKARYRPVPVYVIEFNTYVCCWKDRTHMVEDFFYSIKKLLNYIKSKLIMDTKFAKISYPAKTAIAHYASSASCIKFK